MYYMIYSQDNEGTLELRKQTRPKHIEHLQPLIDQGRLLAAGPLPAVDSADAPEAGFTGSLVIAEFADLESAQNWADADPYKAAGVYKGNVVKPYKIAFP